jgi:hypothetical protein
MIWIKLKHKDADKAVIYTSNPEMAEFLGCTKKRKGKFWYRIIGSLKLRRVLGFAPPVETKRGNYMKMIHQYPPASVYIKHRQKLPEEIRQQMEIDMQWNPETKHYIVPAVLPPAPEGVTWPKKFDVEAANYRASEEGSDV